MSGESLVGLRLRVLREWRKFYDDPLKYARMIKDVVRGADPEARVMLFGSAVKGCLRPDSDIDVLIVTELASNVENRLRLRVAIAKVIGDCTPFETHIVTPEEFRDWYSRFIDKYVEV